MYPPIKLAIWHYLKLKCNPSSPVYSYVCHPKSQDEFEDNPERGPLGIHMKPHLEILGLDTFPVSHSDLQKFDFWDHWHPPVFLDLVQHKKDTTLPALYRSKYLEIMSRYEDPLYWWIWRWRKSWRCSLHQCRDLLLSTARWATVFSAELKTLLLALEHVSKSQNDKFTTFPESLSALHALQDSDFWNSLSMGKCEVHFW